MNQEKCSTKYDDCQEYLNIFKGRLDVVPKYYSFNNSDGEHITGYTVMCKLSGKPACPKKSGDRNTCRDCPDRIRIPMSDELLKRHFSGDIRLGIYPLMPDNTCHFIAADFDQHEDDDGNTRSPSKDVIAFSDVCEANDIPCRRPVSGHRKP